MHFLFRDLPDVLGDLAIAPFGLGVAVLCFPGPWQSIWWVEMAVQHK